MYKLIISTVCCVFVSFWLAVAVASAAPCDIKYNDPPFIRHDLTNVSGGGTVSYCELCGYGYITIVISNFYSGVDMTDMTVVENLGGSGLTFDSTAPTPVTYRVNGGPLMVGSSPAVSGANDSILTWDSTRIAALGRLEYLPSNHNYSTIAITFAVSRAAGLTQEGLISASRLIQADLTYSTDEPCFAGSMTVTTGQDLLPLREPVPAVSKEGRNVDAGQGSWLYAQTIYGHINDDVIWRIRVPNNGQADLQDLRFDDLMQTGNLVVNYACPTEAAAAAIAANNGVDPGGGGCVAAGNSIDNFDVDNPFGNPSNDSPDRVDVRQGESADIYLVGKIPAAPNGSCSAERTNTVSDIQWGCEADSPAGGISATSTGATPGSATAVLNTFADSTGNNLFIRTRIVGTNTAQPAGSKGTVRITIQNNTGGTVKGIRLRNILPVEYVVDPTFTPTVTATPAYGAYAGMTDRIEWTNPVAGTFPLTTTDPAVALSNTAPEFRLYSSSTHPVYADQFDLLRHGDRLVVTFRIVLVRPQSYDKTANLDVRTESPDSDPPGTDPDNAVQLTNQLYVDFEDFCNPGVIKHPPTNPLVTPHQFAPEDLDIDIAGDELIFILTGDPDQRLPLTVNLTNRGGHDAADYVAYVTFGATMNVVSAPAGCSVAGNPTPLTVWQEPASIPADALVYQCTGGAIAPGQTVALGFEVVKSTDPVALETDDLTFRGDVIGEITLSDGTPLWFPAPTARSDGILDRADNFSLDGIRARVIGFNLLKSQVGTCSENNPPPTSPDRQVQIGEECSYHIETGGWFGFKTPGFTYIAVQDIRVFDQLPDGQGYISSTDPSPPVSTYAIQGISFNPAGLAPLDEVAAPDWMNWAFNQVVPAQRIRETDHWFRVDMTSRLLNDPIDVSAAPNRHAALSTNTLNSYFQAVFSSDTPGQEEEVYDLGPSTVGYPRVEVRRIALTVTEPHLTVVKEVCNESLYGSGPSCSNFVPLAADGDAYNSYIYRLTLTNQAQSDGVPRAPAYDVIVTDQLDASDLPYVLPFGGDGLDNDGDGAVGGADGDGEGALSDNVVKNGVPAVITFSHTHSTALRRIDPGQSVRLYYRVDYDDDAAPLQTFTNTAQAVYDSLTGDSGNQSAPQGLNSEIGGARVYTSEAASASVRIIPVETQPKRIAGLSNTPPAAGPDTQGVSIGEEIEYRLNTLLPVALLRDFVIRDELPAGMTCIEAPAVNLSAPPYADAGFIPGGTITPTCSGQVVEWNFGDQRVTHGTVGNRYDFAIGFIARIDNTAATNDGDVIANGHPATAATARYIDETGSLVSHDFGQVDVRVREPRIELTKTFTEADADAGDILTVTVTAANTGTADAYNLRVLDDLSGRNLSFVGNVGGADPPDTVDTATFGANQPVFSWNPPNGIAPGGSISFTFEVRVDTAAQPLEVLDNTIQADWTSLPSQTTALNSSGSIGADGSASGMRIGALPNAGHAVNDYESGAGHQVTVPPVTLAKTDLDPAAVPAVGWHKSFRIDIHLPEGTTQNVTVTDNLNAGAVSYVLADNADYDVTYTFQGIATINGQAPGEAALNAVPADGAGGSVVWDIGTVVTQTENDPDQSAVDPMIAIHYFGRIHNDLVTDSGDTLHNSVVLNHSHGETGAPVALTDDTAPVTVVEAVLTATKTVRNVTTGKQPGDPAAGGDLLEYALTVANSGTSTAHDVNVVDTLPSGLSLYTGFTPTAAIAGTGVAGFSATPAGSPNGPLVWGRDNADGSLDIPAGQSLVLTYQVVVAETGGELSNSVWVDWTSLDGADSYERTGQGCPNWTAPNDYCTGPAVAAIPSVDDTSMLKEVSADTYDVPPLSTAADAIARIGDTITYRLALNLRGGLTRAVQVQDTLPGGMVFVDTVRINGDATADYTPPAAGAGSNFAYAPITGAQVPATGQTGTLVWTIGDMVNDPFGDPTTDTFEIVYRARIQPDAGIAHVASTTITNSASLDYTGAPSLSDSAPVTVLQPIISELTKTDRGGLTSPAAVNVATDIMQFRVQACNSGSAPAYSVQVTDQLADQFDENSLTTPVVSVGGTVLNAGSDYSYTPPAGRGGTLEFILNTPLDPGQCVVIDYDIGFHTDFGPNQVWHNSAAIDAYWSLPAQSGQQYGPVGPAVFSMHNVADTEPPAKTIVSPGSGETTIGQEIVYHISVPATAVNAAMYDVTLIDTLDSTLELVSAAEISGNGFTLTDTSVPPNQVNLSISQIPAGQQALIELRARLRNIDGADAGVTFTNSVLYTFADTPGGTAQGGGSDETAAIRIVEPQLNLSKAVVNLSPSGNPPQAGDSLRYTLTLDAAGGAADDNFSDAFDVSIDDSLSLGLVYDGNVTVSGAGNSIAAPAVTGDGTTTPQTLVWSLEQGNAAIDIPEGTGVSVSYDVRVLDTVLGDQALSNSATARWTGIDGASVLERNGTGTPACNDYITEPAVTELTTPDNTSIAKTSPQDTFGAGDSDVRIGDIVAYKLRLALQEGAYQNVVVTDTLPQGLVFEGTAAVNGDATAPYAAVEPFVHADITAASISVAGDPAAGPTTVTWNLGDILNAVDADPANDAFVIVYRARVLNDAHAHVNAIALANTVRLDYDTAGGPADPQTDSTAITIRQPNLTVAKSAPDAGGDTVLAADELVTYAIEIRNSGSAPAYDTVLEDIIPAGMRLGGATITMVSTQLLSGAVLPNPAPVYDSASGLATWNLDSGMADQYSIPAGDTLRIVYQVQTDSTIGAGMTLTNQARVTLYYSFDDEAPATLGGVTGVRQVYGPTNTAATTFTTASPDALVKQNPAVTTVSVGQPFSYRITVPATPQPTALHDVRILDDLGASAADLSFVGVTKVSGSQPWTPVNTGSATNLVIEDPVIGIDIPAGEQIVLDITVVLDDTTTNRADLTFSNTADYTYNPIDNDPTTQAPGGPDTTADMSIVAPDALTLEKSGPVTMSAGTPAGFTLNVRNTGSGTAWNPVITDRFLPHEATGGMCAAGPDNVTAQLFLADEVTPASAPLVEGTDFTVDFSAEPDCQWRLRLLSPAGGIAAGQHLIVHYDLRLDPSTANGIKLTNVAGATRWYSADPDTAGAAPHVYDHELTDGTPEIIDYQDNHTVTTQAPVLAFRKSVQNLTTGQNPNQNPGSHASPGDTLRYTIQVINSGPVGLSDLTVVDEVDRLNTVPVFAAGSLNIVSVPPGADISGSSALGGTHGTGRVHVADLAIAAQDDPGDTIEVIFDITLAPVITSGTVVLNQAELVSEDLNPTFSDSDDPNLDGDADPTETLIASAPLFEVHKTSTILSGDPNILMAGETLRYTITIRNIGSEDAVNVRLRDFTPANTTYVGGSATLNGAAVAEPVPGVNPLHAGILVNAPVDTTAGYLPADAARAADHAATVCFDVVVDPHAMDGLIVENQGFVTGSGQGSGPMPEQPSDDPGTPTPDDPTLDIVGNLPLLYAHKTVQIFSDSGSLGIVDPDDVLRYTIEISNFGAIAATGVVLSDGVPAHTAYVSGSLRLNGLPLGPDGGVSPLIAGLPVHSADNPGSGIVSAGQSAVITFEVRVDTGVAAETIISNQGSVTSDQLSPEPTDADGIPSNGRQPTVIVVGEAQVLTITKEVRVAGGGAAQPGGQLEYVIRVTNVGSLPATHVRVTDNLGSPLGDQVAYIDGSGSLNGSAAGVTYAGALLTADYASQYGDLQPGAGLIVRFRVQIDPALAIGTPMTNTGEVHWNDPAQSASASVSLDVGGTPGSASLNGNIWHDAYLDKFFDVGAENSLADWSVELYRNGQLAATVLTDADGAYRLSGLVPNQGTPDEYAIRFRAAGAGPNTPSLGYADSPFTNGPQRISAISVASGANLQDLNLPLWPNGAVYNSVVREPVAGAQVALLNAATGQALPELCFDDPVQQNQVTALDGFYKFDVNFSQSACPAGGAYLIEVTPPSTGYLPGPSQIIPPASDAATAPFSIPTCPGSADDAIPATAELCEAVGSASVPPVSVPPRTAGTRYYLHLLLSNANVPGHSQIFNNPIPVDPQLDGAVAITKTSSMLNATRASLVPYTITVTNVYGVPLYDIDVVDTLPPGFKYVAGSARLDGDPVKPRISGRELVWDGLELAVNARYTIRFLLVVGAGVSEGEYVNRAAVRNGATHGTVSGEATATVQILPDPTFDCTDVIGKVFDDRNLNGQQDGGEQGLAGVRVVTVRGLIAATDEHGRFHITCAAVPDEDIGGNFILKLDERSLPTGFRLTTENPRVQRATRGKMLRFHFGATIHRVVRLDIADGMFEPGTSGMRLQWIPKITQLIAELHKAPSVLRLSYLADVEREGLVDDRLDALEKEIIRQWAQSDGGYRLAVETEVFWRRGAPYDGR